MNKKINTFFKRKWAYFAVAPFTVFAIFPFIWMLITALQPSKELYNMASNPFIIEGGITFEHFGFLFNKTLFKTWFVNSATVSVTVTSISILVSVFAGYSLTRIKFWGAKTIGLGVFLTYLVPPTLLFIPLYRIVSFLGVGNSILSLILTYPTFTIPFSTWLLMGYFSNVPRELEEAAMIDGASWLQSLLKVTFPLAIPGIVAATLFCFTLSWAHLIYALAFISASGQKPLTSAILGELIRGDIFYWGPLMAAALLGSVPIVFVYSFLLDYYVAGLTKGAVKF